MTSTENKKALRIIMLAASLPPLPAGGAEMQALQLADELNKEGHQVVFITPGSSLGKGKSVFNGHDVYRLHSAGNKIFKWLAKKKKNTNISDNPIEFDDRKQL